MSAVKQIVNSSILDKVIALPKKLQAKPVQITIKALDETEYLLFNKANKKHLMNSIDDYKNKKGLTIVPIEEFNKWSNNPKITERKK